MWSFLSWKIKGTVDFSSRVLLWNQKKAKLSAETPVKEDANAPKDFTTNCVWATDVFVFSKCRDLELIWILNSLRCFPSASVLTKASNTSVSKVSLSEFSIMMLKSASRVSCRNWNDKMHHIIWQDDAHWKAHWSVCSNQTDQNLEFSHQATFKAANPQEVIINMKRNMQHMKYMSSGLTFRLP